MLPIFLEQDHRQQAGPIEAARDGMEWCRRLADLLTNPAGELLAHRLDHLPLARHRLQRLGDILADLGQPVGAAAGAGLRRRDHDALARQVGRERLAALFAACERTHRRSRRLFGPKGRLARRRLRFLQLQLELIEQAAAAL